MEGPAMKASVVALIHFIRCLRINREGPASKASLVAASRHAMKRGSWPVAHPMSASSA